LFADDQSLIYPNEQELQQHINTLNENCRQYNMKINIEKTEVMTISKMPITTTVYVENSKIRQVNEFKYLGSYFTEDGKFDREIEARIQKANAVTYQLSPLLRHPSISMNTKLQLIRSIFIPTLCYQCQTWTLNINQERKIQTCEIRCLKKAVNKTRLNKVRNIDVRNTIGILPCLEFIGQQRLKWFGHLVRMQHDQPAVQAYNTRYEGYRSKGRPRKRWIDCVSET
jgi:hypothetical protein